MTNSKSSQKRKASLSALANSTGMVDATLMTATGTSASTAVAYRTMIGNGFAAEDVNMDIARIGNGFAATDVNVDLAIGNGFA